MRAGNKEVFNAAIAEAAKNPKMAEVIAARGRPFAQPTPYDTFAAALEYNLRDVIRKIKTPLLITDPDEETFWPGQSKEMYEQLTGDREIIRFSRREGANWHCEPMGRLSVELQMLDLPQDQLLEKTLIVQTRPVPLSSLRSRSHPRGWFFRRDCGQLSSAANADR